MPSQGSGDADLTVAVDVAEHLGNTSYIYADRCGRPAAHHRASGIPFCSRSRHAHRRAIGKTHLPVRQRRQSLALTKSAPKTKIRKRNSHEFRTTDPLGHHRPRHHRHAPSQTALPIRVRVSWWRSRARNPEKPGLGDGFPGARIVKGYDALLDRSGDRRRLHRHARIPAMPSGRSRRLAPASMCWWKSRLRFRPSMRKRSTTKRARPASLLGEAFMYRLHPQTAKIVELVKSGVIGDGAHHPLKLRLQHGQLQARASLIRQRYWRAAAFWMSVATRSRWRG